MCSFTSFIHLGGVDHVYKMSYGMVFLLIIIFIIIIAVIVAAVYFYYVSPAGACPSGGTLYGGGQFCCVNGQVSADGTTCTGGSVCAVSPNTDTQGNPLCTPVSTTCPTGYTSYFTGLLCCNGTVSNDGKQCTGSTCYAYPNNTFGAAPCLAVIS